MTANQNNHAWLATQSAFVLRISLNALLMKLVMGQSGLILSDLLRLVSMGGSVQVECQI